MSSILEPETGSIRDIYIHSGPISGRYVRDTLVTDEYKVENNILYRLFLKDGFEYWLADNIEAAYDEIEIAKEYRNKRNLHAR